MVKFPSTAFFDALKLKMDAEQARFRRLGFIDTSFGVAVVEDQRPRNFVLTFEVFELKEIREVAELHPAELDFVIAGGAEVWREMLENIRRHGAADAQHDINTLTHFGEGLKVTYADPDGHDKLYRFMESIQQFFDLSSQIEITY